jgi:hypothetical protein
LTTAFGSKSRNRRSSRRPPLVDPKPKLARRQSAECWWLTPYARGCSRSEPGSCATAATSPSNWPRWCPEPYSPRSASDHWLRPEPLPALAGVAAMRGPGSGGASMINETGPHAAQSRSQSAKDRFGAASDAFGLARRTERAQAHRAVMLASGNAPATPACRQAKNKFGGITDGEYHS